MYTISKQFEFSASHRLSQLPDSHPCARLHGHNYTVWIELTGELDERGFVVDYGDLASLKQMIDSTLDHRHLNDVLPCYPTAENIAKWLYDWAKKQWPQVTAIRVSETEKTWAEYRP